MKLERNFEGLAVTLEASGKGRFGSVTFLLVWLTFWIVGEAFALWILGWGAWCLLTGQPPGEGRALLEPAPALAMGLFLLAWVSFWTLGGILAGSEVLRLLFGRDRLVARPDGLAVTRSYGLFRTRLNIPREQLRRFYFTKTGNILSVVTTRGSVELSRNSTAPELESLVSVLTAEFNLTPEADTAGVLPKEWSELTSPEGESILVRNPTTRRQQAWVVWAVVLLLVPSAAFIANAGRAQPSLGVLAAIVGAFALLALWGAYRLTWCRDEWLLHPGRLGLQRRTYGRLAAQFEAGELQLREDRDSDGDPWYRLFALRAGAPNPVPLAEARQHQREIAGTAGDPTDLHQLSRWLAHRCALPFSDRTTPEAKAADFTELKQQLASSGRFGRWASRVLDKVGPAQR